MNVIPSGEVNLYSPWVVIADCSGEKVFNCPASLAAIPFDVS